MSQTALDYEELVEVVKGIVRQALHDPEATIRVTRVPRDRAEFVVISDAFEDLTQKERQDMLWDPIRAALGPDAQRIALILPRTWDDVR
ncbi:hypothetical protein LLH23_18025 [bacterium]|nr:hypothetical protein [bacterium]